MWIPSLGRAYPLLYLVYEHRLVTSLRLHPLTFQAIVSDTQRVTEPHQKGAQKFGA